MEVVAVIIVAIEVFYSVKNFMHLFYVCVKYKRLFFCIIHAKGEQWAKIHPISFSGNKQKYRNQIKKILKKIRYEVKLIVQRTENNKATCNISSS